MAHSTEVGAELAADHRLIELLCRQLPLESDELRRKAMLKRIVGILDWHETFDRRYLGVDEPVPETVPVPDPSAGADGALESLTARAQQHIQQEEEHTLPKFESRVSWFVLEDLGERAREMRTALTPA